MSSFTDRMIGAARLDVSTYEEVEADETAMGQAITVVVVSSLAAGIGSFRVAVRQALDYRSTGRAIGVCLIGFVINLLVMAAFGTVFGIGGALMGGIR